MKFKNFARGVGAGLQTLAVGLQDMNDKERAEKLREEKEKKETERWEAERADQEIINKQLMIQNKLAKIKLSHTALASTAAKTKYNPVALAPVMSEHSGDNYVYTYNEAESRKQTQLANAMGFDRGVGDGTKKGEAISFDLGTYELLADGTHKIDEVTGKKVINPLPGKDFQTQTFSNQDDFVSHVNGMMNPGNLLARWESKQTIAETNEHVLKMQAAKDKLAVKHQQNLGKTEQTEARTKNIQEDTKIKQRAAKGGAPEDTSYNTPFGTVKKTKQGMISAREDQEALINQGFDGLTVREAIIIEEVQKNETARKQIMAAAKDGKKHVRKRNRIANELATKLKISNNTAKIMLDKAMESINDELGWYDRIMNPDTPDNS